MPQRAARAIFIVLISKGENGTSDGTRTRDLRPDRPVKTPMFSITRAELMIENCVSVTTRMYFASECELQTWFGATG